MRQRRVLVLGGGGREHAIVWKVNKDDKNAKIYCIPGNGGISLLAECYNIDLHKFDDIVKFIKEKEIEVVIVGPEAPLVKGIADVLRGNRCVVLGVSQRAALLEGSKVYAKNFMTKYNIPTARFKECNSVEEARKYLSDLQAKGIEKTVVKADGLAAGKGAVVCDSLKEANSVVEKFMVEKIFGSSGERVVIEEYLSGEEATILAFCDGITIKPLVSSQDHKRAYDNDEGPNTGGMGAYAPTPVVDDVVWEKIEKNIFTNFLYGLQQEGIDYRGVIYFGLMITPDNEPKVLEFNCRLGDPEAQVVLPLLETPLVDIAYHVEERKLSTVGVELSKKASVCVVMASGGYPGDYEKGKEIFGLEKVEKEYKDVIIFHAGTEKKNVDGRERFFTSGGRVLGVTAIGEDLASTLNKAYKAVGAIYFEKMHYRRDIGRKALKLTAKA